MVTRTSARRILGVALVMCLSVLCSCGPQKVVTCHPGEAYDPDKGECFTCPSGTYVDYKTASCKALPQEDIGPQDAEPDPQDMLVTSDESTGDAVGDSELLGQDVDSGELSPDIGEGSGTVGAECAMDLHCQEGLSCFDWPGGYCVHANCAIEEDCPEGSHCLPLMENGAACFQGCEGDGDCRPGYGCKGIPMLSGATRFVCHPAEDDGLHLGEPCKEHGECDASLACIPLGPTSVCTMTGCSGFSPCPEGSSCVLWGVLTLCLPQCGGTEDCALFGDSDVFDCLELKDVTDNDTQVCSIVQSGNPIGLQCYYGTECETGYCHVLVSGKCSDTLDLCGSDHDCDEGLCIAEPAVQTGVCSKPCGPGDSCGAGAFCVMTGAGAMCLAECTEYAAPCGPAGFSMSCMYGTLHYPPAPSGKYACAKNLGGEGGTTCSQDGQCAGGICYGQEGPEGYCATDCAVSSDCPFGSQCQDSTLVQGENLCTRICFSDLDCGPGFTCKNTFFSEKACMVP
jgi:hypothetical protein